MMFRTNLLLMKWKTINLSKKKRYLLPRHYVRCTFERIWNILKIIWMFESELNIWMNAKSQIRFETQPTSPPQMRRKDSSSKTHECLTSEIPDHLNIFRIWSSTKVSIWVSSWLLIWYQKWRTTFLFFVETLISVNLRKFEKRVGENALTAILKNGKAPLSFSSSAIAL